MTAALDPFAPEFLADDPPEHTMARRVVAGVLSAPVQTFFRTTTRPVELDGVAIGEGEKLLLFLGAANRDPRQWDEPDTFDISRRATGHVGFGFGIHVCVGMAMARLEGEAVLTALARHVAEIEQVGEPRRMLNNTLRGLERLPLRLVPT